ncbi:hypothetical protein [Pengzhenrongella sp.]|uniref:hypothetical protein n=1 Tax=Pengzhenrongella sp. TaxID=2888820 RepID=UPI002F954631
MSTEIARQPEGTPTGGQFAGTTRAEAAGVELAPDRALRCDQCGTRMSIGPDEVSNHVDQDGGIDFDRDADHVPYTGDGDSDVPDPRADELEALTEDAEDEYRRAFEAAQEAESDTDQATEHGDAGEQALYSLLLSQRGTDLATAGRRRDAVRLAVDPQHDRPPYEEFARPTSTTTLRRAVRDIKTGRVRGLVIRSDLTAKMPVGALEIAAPINGRPVFVEVASGFAPLKVTSGLVVVEAESYFGNAVDVEPGAGAVVFPGEGAKLSTRTHSTGITVIVGSPDVRGLQIHDGPGGHLDILGERDMHLTVFRRPER